MMPLLPLVAREQTVKLPHLHRPCPRISTDRSVCFRFLHRQKLLARVPIRTPIDAPVVCDARVCICFQIIIRRTPVVAVRKAMLALPSHASLVGTPSR